MRTAFLSLFVLAFVATAVHADNQSTRAKRRSLLHKHPTLVRMLQRNNQWRTASGLAAQRLNPALTQAAQDHANYMARTGSFSHFSNGDPMYRAQKYQFTGLVRENIAMGQVTINETFQSWRNSGGHWANVCCDAPVAGFGYARDANGNAYWVGMYGYPTAEDEAREQAVRAEESEKSAGGSSEEPSTAEAAIESEDGASDLSPDASSA